RDHQLNGAGFVGLRVPGSREADLRTNDGAQSGPVPYVRTVKTKSGATAVQVVWSSRRGSREIEHIGSAHDEAELEALRAAAAQAGRPARSTRCASWTKPG